MSEPNTVSHISANILARQQILTMKFKEKITPHFGANVVYIGIQCPWDLNLSKIFNCNLIILSITAALCNHSSIILCSHIFLLKILKILYPWSSHRNFIILWHLNICNVLIFETLIFSNLLRASNLLFLFPATCPISKF